MIERSAMPGLFLPATTTDHDTVQAAVAALPVGAFGQHGPYLPLVTDTLIATAITEAIREHHKVFRLPPITFGCSYEHSTFPETLSLGPATLAAVVTDISTSLVQQGISALIVVNGHGGNYVLGNVVNRLMQTVRCASGCIQAVKTGRKLARPPAS
jgi:creatinine amidohydrolase